MKVNYDEATIELSKDEARQYAKVDDYRERVHTLALALADLSGRTVIIADDKRDLAHANTRGIKAIPR